MNHTHRGIFTTDAKNAFWSGENPLWVIANAIQNLEDSQSSKLNVLYSLLDCCLSI